MGDNSIHGIVFENPHGFRLYLATNKAKADAYLKNLQSLNLKIIRTFHKELPVEVEADLPRAVNINVR